jgi:hypothetical protein
MSDVQGRLWPQTLFNNWKSLDFRGDYRLQILFIFVYRCVEGKHLLTSYYQTPVFDNM